MAVRMLEGETWQRVLDRVRGYGGPLAVAWAGLVGSRSTETDVVALTIRGDQANGPVHYQYDRLEIRREIRDSEVVSKQLESGVIEPSRVEFPALTSDAGGIAYWVGRNTEYGLTAPMSRPSYYYVYPVFGQLFSSPPAQRARLDAPLAACGQDYWPRASDAVLEVVFGVTRHQRRRDISPELIIHLPYLGPHIEDVTWVDDQGLSVVIGALSTPAARAFELHSVWTAQREERQLRRHHAYLAGTQFVAVPMESPPIWYAIGLVDPGGVVVDSVEGSFAQDQLFPNDGQLPPEALLEAFDFLASVWRNVFRRPFFGAQRQITSVGSLALPVTTRADFESRLSQLDALMKSIVVDDDLMDPADPEATKDKTLNRLQSVFKARFGAASPEYAVATNAIRRLRTLNDVRNAVQHANVTTDLPAALAAAGLGYPPDWARDWEQLRRAVRASLADLRSVLLASL